MKITETNLPGVLIVEPRVFGDERGFFFESYNKLRYEEVGIRSHLVQDNVSLSARGVLRGLHFQNPNSQGKLVSVLQGEVFDVAVDLRKNSKTFGKVATAILSSENKRQLWIPAGFAHGFLVTSEMALFTYKCDAFYSPESEHTLAWDDPDLAINWPSTNPTVSEKDRSGLRLKDLDPEDLPN